MLIIYKRLDLNKQIEIVSEHMKEDDTLSDIQKENEQIQA